MVGEKMMLVEEAKSKGISRRTAFNWNDEWQERGVIIRIRHDVFKKQLAVA